MSNLVDLKNDELKEIEGGGGIIADFIHFLKCTCSYENFDPRSGQIYYY